jgi:3-methyladenine DNA glycosylase AlkD
VPVQRTIAKQYTHLPLPELQKLLDSPIHEYRLIALLVLIQKYLKADEKTKQNIYTFYLKNAKSVNNRDLVDLSAPNIVGNYLIERDKKILYTLAKSKNIREKRIAIISTFAFLKVGLFEDTFQIAELLMKDGHDLIHKAVGRMLREVGKRSQYEEEKFLKLHYKNMPRTMLRYAIERFEESKRQKYLKGSL